MFLKVLEDLGADQDASFCAGFPLGSGEGMSSGGTVTFPPGLPLTEL